MRIFDIMVYRDGGSLEFRVERDDKTKHVWLETPFGGEPRALRIDSNPTHKGAPEIGHLLKDIEEWWNSLPSALQTRALEIRTRKDAFRNANSETLEAIGVHRVLLVRDYVAKTYLETP